MIVYNNYNDDNTRTTTRHTGWETGWENNYNDENLKDQNISVQDRVKSEVIFNKPIETVRQKNVTSNIMGADTVIKTQNPGETIKALGGSDFLKKLQQEYGDAGKPICDNLETILVKEIEPRVVSTSSMLSASRTTSTYIECNIYIEYNVCTKWFYDGEVSCSTREDVNNPVIATVFVVPAVAYVTV